MDRQRLVAGLADLLFSRRRLLLFLFALATAALAWSASRLRADAGFTKMIPLHHEYMKTFTFYQKTFGGANRVIVALRKKDGDIFTPEFFKTLKDVTDEVFYIRGIERSSITSLFTPNVRFIEVVEEGFAGGNVIPADFKGTAEDLDKVRRNILKSAVGRTLVSKDLKGAMVRAELLEIDPVTGQRLDYPSVARQLEAIRAKFQSGEVSVHVIGFSKAIGDITEGAVGVLLFLFAAFVITALLLWKYENSWRLAGLALACALVPVVWMLGLLPLLGYGIDPMSILVPFLIFSIGVSHAVQMTHVWQMEASRGAEPLAAARTAFLQLFIPGALALATDGLAFLVLLHIRIEIVQELAVTSSLGVILMIITNKMLLPILLSYNRLLPGEAERAARQERTLDGLWRALSTFAVGRRTAAMVAAWGALLALAAWTSRDLKTGDLGKGLPELRQASRYNKDNAAIVDNFAIGVDVLSVIAQSRGVDGACTDYEVMDAIDAFEARLRDVEGVQSVISLPGLAKTVNGGFNEGSLKWRALSRNPAVLAQSVTPIDTSSGLLNTDCSAMQIMIFLKDHQGETLARVVREVKAFGRENPSPKLSFLLASANAGVMAATNEAVDAAQVSMLISIYAVTILLCWLTFGSWRATLCIIIPLAIVSVLCNAVMVLLGIGLKVATLPVIALGVGVGVDYGIYFFERLQDRLAAGLSMREAFYETLKHRGAAAIFTSLTMSVGVGSWAFSALKFQADMGGLLAFMFLVNMLGAVFLLPALATILIKPAAAKGRE